MYIQCMVGFSHGHAMGWDFHLSSSDARARSNESDARHVSRARDLGRAIDDTFNDGITSLTFRARDDDDDDDASVLLVSARSTARRARTVSRRDRATRDPSDARRPGAVRDFSRNVRSRACVGLLDGSARACVYEAGLIDGKLHIKTGVRRRRSRTTRVGRDTW